MNPQTDQKIYVAIGNDMQDGFKTLGWTLQKWKSNPISIVILHITFNNSIDFVYTPFGKLPASSVSEEKLEIVRMHEEDKIDKLLSKCVNFCGQVKADILKVMKSDEPLQKFIVDLISELKISILVMGVTFLKSSPWKSRSAISGIFYVNQNKPEFCELYMIWGGKQVFVRGENHEIIMENDEGIVIAKVKDKPSLKTWLGKMFHENNSIPTFYPLRNSDHSSATSSSSSTSLESPSQNQWDKNGQKLDEYFEQMLSLNLEEEEEEAYEQGIDDSSESDSPMEHDMIDINANLSCEERNGILRGKIDEVRESMNMKRIEAKENVERQVKAEWAIALCSSRAEELESQTKEEVTNGKEFRKQLHSVKQNTLQIKADIEETKNTINSLLQHQSNLSINLQTSILEKSWIENRLQKSVTGRAEIVREIEELNSQRELLHRRIEYCREKDGINMADDVGEGNYRRMKEYSAEDIRLATDDFEESMKLSSMADGRVTVFKGRIDDDLVAIELLNTIECLSRENFQAQVELFSHLCHPNVVAMLGFCLEPPCIVFEYMPNGSLKDILFPSIAHQSTTCHPTIWRDRIRIAVEVCSGLAFLHQAQPSPIAHGDLTISNILLDHNLVAKVGGLRLGDGCDESAFGSDIRAFGRLLLNLLMGRNLAEIGAETLAADRMAFVQDLDEMAGEWPLDLAEELVSLARMCVSMEHRPGSELSIIKIMEALNEIRCKADNQMASEGPAITINGGGEDLNDVPRIFICPISQRIMRNPQVAADGHSYEAEAIEEWINTGHYTSPITHSKLQHTLLIPNHTLRSLIKDWLSQLK